MEHAYFAGLTMAETASQLVLGATYCALHVVARKHVEWLGFGLGCLALAIGCFAALAMSHDDSTAMRVAAIVFAASTTVAVAFVVFGLAWWTQSTYLRRLGWVTAVTGALWQPLLGYYHSNPSITAAVTTPWFARAIPATPAVSAVAWLFFAFLASLLVVAIALFAREPRTHRVERMAILVGLACLAVGFGFDALGARRDLQGVQTIPHAATAFALSLAVAMLHRYRWLANGSWTAEQRVAQFRQELATAQATIERVQRELGAKKQLAVVGELAAAIAHEVRNPLAIIMNAAAGLRRPTLGSEDRTTLLSILDEETARLNRLVTDLLRFARPVIIKRSAVSIVELARRAEGRLEDKHRLSISIPDQPSLKFVQADANLLRLVFDNLVSNAFQAMPEGGVVGVVVSEYSPEDIPFVRIDIIDEGHGMDNQVLARATDPFYTTRPSGTGLGLPIVQRIVEAHGGRMEIDSTPGRGTKVSLFLPFMVPAAEPNPAVEGTSA